MSIPNWQDDATVISIQGQITTVTDRKTALEAEYQTKKAELEAAKDILKGLMTDLELGDATQEDVDAQQAIVNQKISDFEVYEQEYLIDIQAKDEALNILQGNLEDAIKTAKANRLDAIKTALLQSKTANYAAIMSAMDKLKEMVDLEVLGMQESGFQNSFKCGLYQMELNRILALVKMLATKFDYSVYQGASNELVFKVQRLYLSGYAADAKNWKNGDDMPEYNPA